MNVFIRLLRRALYLLRRRSMDETMDEEMRFHIDMETEKNLRAGMGPAEARRAALVAFGGVERHREATREARGTALVESVVRDGARAFRNMRRAPISTFTAVTSLALGLAATALVLVFAEAFLLRPLDAPDPDRLVSYEEDHVGPGGNSQSGHSGVAYARYRQMAAAAAPVADLAAYTYDGVSLVADGQASAGIGTRVSRNYFRALGLRPAVGRFFEPSDEGEGGPPEVVLSAHYWRTALGGDPDVVGQSIRVDGRPHTVVGVAPEGFNGVLLGLASEVWVPADLWVYSADGSRRPHLAVFGRLTPGTTSTAATTAIDRVARSLPPEVEGSEIRRAWLDPLTPVPEAFRGSAVSLLGILLAMAGLVLAVAAANVGGILLVRAAGRRREATMRMALGAPRGRLIRTLATETLVLFLAGAAAGLVLAFWLAGVVEAYHLPVAVRVAVDLSLDLRVALVAVGIMLLVGLTLGCVTGVQATARLDANALRGGWAGEPPRSIRLRRIFGVAQLAVTAVLLFSGGLFVRTVQRALAVDPGLDPAGLVMAPVSPGAAGYGPEESEAFIARLLERLRARPDLEAAVARTAPLSGGVNSDDIELADGRTVPTHYGWAEGAWFQTAGARIVRGRAFGPDEARDGTAPAVINESLAARLWPGESPLGRTFRLRGVDRTVVGVVADGRYRDMAEVGAHYAFLPFPGRFGSPITVFLRSSDRSTATAVGALREELAALDPDVTPRVVTPMEDQIAYFLAPQRAAGWLIGVFGLVGLTLACVGLFGITAFQVAQRVREIGIRVALGAPRGRVARAVVSSALRMTAVGLILGVVGGLVVSRLASRFLFGVGLADPWLLLTIPTILVAATLLASWVPARRATRVDPAKLLRDA